MKKYVLFSLALLLSLVYACTDVETVLEQAQETPNEVELIEDYNFKSFNMPFPEETFIEIKESALHFRLPATHYVVGITKEGTFYRSEPASLASVTCDCTQGSGCNPVSLPKGKEGCFMVDGCSSCDKSLASIQGAADPFTDLIICDENVDPFVKNYDDLEGLYLLPAKFLDYPPVERAIKEIEAKYVKGTSKETTIMFANIFGYIVPLKVPADIGQPGIMAREPASIAGAITCECNNGNTGCEKKSKLIATWCDAGGCTSCTLNSRVVNTDGDVRLLIAKAGGKITLQ